MGNLAPLNGECPRSGARAPRLTCPNIGVELPMVRPRRLISSGWPRPTSTMLVPQALVRNRPRRIIKCSSRPSADTREIRSVSASSSAAPQRLTAELTVCHTQPRSAATSLIEDLVHQVNDDGLDPLIKAALAHLKARAS